MMIEIIVDPKGTTTLQTKGITGQGCREASQWLETVIGQVVTDHATPEFYQAHGNTTHAQQKHV